MDIIFETLDKTERENNIKILHAVESGSRAWGFASPDSDYDIRFIYKNPADFYLQLWDKPDTIEFMTEQDLDGSGWDLAKALRLLAKSNAPLIEWLNSPIVYHSDTHFMDQMRSLAAECFSPIATMHHYLGTTKTFLESCSLENIKLKSLFYGLRTVLAAKWIVVNNSFPPVAFKDLLPIAPPDVTELINELVEIKAAKDEKYLHPEEKLITKFLTETFEFNVAHSQKLAPGKKINQQLEDFFREEIKRP